LIASSIVAIPHFWTVTEGLRGFDRKRLNSWNFRPEIPAAIVIKARPATPRIFNELIKSHGQWRSLEVEWRSGGHHCGSLSANAMFRRSTDLRDLAVHMPMMTDH
jgi:hypothetical protein